VSWAYDTGTYGVGHLMKMSDLTGTTSYTYDQHGRILTKSQVTGGVTLTSTYLYDGYGRLQWFQYPSGAWLDYGYDGYGRVDLVGYSLSVTTTAYFPFGPVTGWTEPNSTKLLRTFDQDGRMTGITLSSTTTANINTQTLTYDNASRITQLAESGLSNQAYGYDAVNRITSYFNGTNTTSWAYDNNGNRLSATLSGTTTYNYSANTNKLSSLTGTTTQSFTYNSDGNQTYDGTHTWSYDGRGLAVSVTAAAATTTYGINGFGQRLSKTATGLSGGGKNEYVYDETGDLIGEYNSTGTAIEETVYLPNTPTPIFSHGTGIAGFLPNPSPVAVMTGGGAAIYSQSPDWKNTPHLIYDASKALAWSWTPDPFGATAPTAPSLTYNVRYRGQYADSESGTNDNGVRIYNPNIPSYLQTDPLGLGAAMPGSYSTYPYVGSNPLTRIDPDGRDFFGVPAPGSPSNIPVSPYSVAPQLSLPPQVASELDKCVAICVAKEVLPLVPRGVTEHTAVDTILALLKASSRTELACTVAGLGISVAEFEYALFSCTSMQEMLECPAVHHWLDEHPPYNYPPRM
jgi:RHS repeat-associated protein